jgi:hypothetical protein
MACVAAGVLRQHRFLSSFDPVEQAYTRSTRDKRREMMRLVNIRACQ